MRKDIKIIWDTIVIDDAFARAKFYKWDDQGNFRFPARLGEAHSHSTPPKIVLNKYVLADNLSPHYKTGIAKFYKKVKENEKYAQAHELHHFHNATAGWNAIAWSNNLTEYIVLSYLDELSSHMAGYLDQEELSQQNIFNAMIRADQDVVIHDYFANQFPREGAAFVSEYSDKKMNMFSHNVDGEKIKKVMNHYFMLKNENVLSKLSKSQQLALGRMISLAKAQALKIVNQQQTLGRGKQKVTTKNA